MQNIPEPSFQQDNPNLKTDIEIFRLFQRAATGLSDALDVVLGINPRAPAIADLEHALGRGLRGVSALKQLRAMSSSVSASKTPGNLSASDAQGQHTNPLVASLKTENQPTPILKKRRHRRHFDVDYKRQVARMIRDRRMTISQASRDLNLTYSAVRRWTMEFDAEQAASSVQSNKSATADAQRICALQEQLRRLQYDNQLLKQASALFAREICNSAPVGVAR